MAVVSLPCRGDKPGEVEVAKVQRIQAPFGGTWIFSPLRVIGSY